MSHECHDCQRPPGPGSVVRLVGKNGRGETIELCSRCWMQRDNDSKVVALGKIKPEGKKKR